jgi:hypothetical protein
MTAGIAAEFKLLEARFAEEKQINGKLSLQLIALGRDEAEINDLILTAYQQNEDATPFLRQLQETFVQRAEATKAMREACPQMEALCHQAADAVGRLIAASQKH